ncbi:MAG: TetR/AcrR family transcriptional regulator [Ghiorsea sp.]
MKEVQTSGVREKILKIAADEIHLHGFQASSTNVIIAKAGLSKGGLYHHFSNKMELGYTVFDEVITPRLNSSWESILNAENPLQAMIEHFRDIQKNTSCDDISKGCPACNLSQEMSLVDEGFRIRIANMMQQWQVSLSQALETSQKKGYISQGLDTTRASFFIIASVQGAQGLAKNAQDKTVLESCLQGLIDYLQMCERGSV